MSGEDALLLLRDALSTNTTISLLAGTDPSEEVFALKACTHIAFSTSTGRTILAKSTATRYTASAAGTAYYDLQTLLLAFLQRDATTGDYLRAAKTEGCAFVSAIERRVVVDWLRGKSPFESERITALDGAVEGTAAEGTTTDEVGKSGKRGEAPEVSGGAVQPKKSRYVVDKLDQEKVKKLMAIIDGPPFGFSAGDGRPDKVAGTSYRNRETVLRGDRINVRLSFSHYAVRH